MIYGDEKKPVDTPEFWKTRLMWALSHGRGSHTAVYDIDYSVWQVIQNQTATVLRGETRQGDHILDAGCGIGTLYSYLPSGRHYTGVDLSPEMIEVARLSYPEAHFEVANLQNLSQFCDQQFDVAICRSIRKMIVDNLGHEAWLPIERELLCVSKKLIITEYETTQYEVIYP
jgi:SAM-dependent methyltransferase